MNETLLRQRKNLVLLGLLILFLSLGDVDIRKISALGIEFDFKTNIKIVYITIWLMWFYFLYRYIIYFYYDGIKSFGKIKAASFEESINPKIKRYVYSKYDKPNDGCAYSYGNIVNWGMVYHGQTKVKSDSDQNDGTEQLINFEIDFNKNRIMLFWRIQALIKFIFIKPAITDYLFPLAFSIFVALIGTISNWPGNPINFFL